MAKLTDPEIIKALKDGKIIRRMSDNIYYPMKLIGVENILWLAHRDEKPDLYIDDLEATDWKIVRDKLSTT